MGLRIIIYLDDMLIMSQSRDLALTHEFTTLNLLEGLGFVVNYERSCLEPSQVIGLLGFEINSQTLTILLPRDKIRNIRKQCQILLDNPHPSVRELSKFLGLLTSSIQAIFLASLHYRNLQFAKTRHCESFIPTRLWYISSINKQCRKFNGGETTYILGMGEPF